MKSYFKVPALVIGILIVGYVFFGPLRSEQKNRVDTQATETPDKSSSVESEFEYNNKCLQAASQVNNLVYPPKEIDPLLPKNKEEQVRWLESDMVDGKVIESTLRERLDYPDTQVFIGYDPSSSDEYQAVELRCGPDFGDGVLLYVVNRTQNKVLAVEANADIRLETFADIDGDKTVDLVFQDVTNGNCWGCSSKRIFLVSGQRYEEIKLPKGFVIGDIVHRPVGLPRGFIVHAQDIRWENSLNLPHCCGPSSHRYFHVDGSRVSDVSPQFKQEYLKLVQLQNENTNYALPTTVSNLLLREAMGERDQGWQRFIEDWKKVEIQDAAIVDGFAEKAFKEFERQYREQKEFTPFILNGDGSVRAL